MPYVYFFKDFLLSIKIKRLEPFSLVFSFVFPNIVIDPLQTLQLAIKVYAFIKVFDNVSALTLMEYLK